MKRNILLIALLVICFSTLVQAQSDIYQRAFNWFPDDAYSSYGYVNLEEAKKAESFDGYVTIMGINGFKMMGNAPDLPDKLFRETTFASFVVPANYDEFVLTEETRDYIFKMGFNRDSDHKIIREKIKILKTMTTNQKNNSFWVLQIPLLSEVMAELVESGSVVALDTKIDDYPVYFHKGGTGKRNIEHFLYGTATEELLIADSINSLKTMMEAGKGTRAKLLDNQDYAEAVAETPEESLIWQASSPLAILNKQLQLLEEKQADEEEIRVTKEKFIGSALYTVTMSVLEEDITISNISIYGSENEAAAEFKETADLIDKLNKFVESTLGEALKQKKDIPDPARKMINKARKSKKRFMDKQSYELEGKMVINTTVWDKRMVKILAQAQQMQKEQQKLQQEKKKKKQAQEQ